MGDRGLLVRYENSVDAQINKNVRLFSEAIDKCGFSWLQDLVFSFHSLLIQYDPKKVGYKKVFETVKSIEASLSFSDSDIESDVKTYEIPTVYGGVFGPDLERVAIFTHRDPVQVIQAFSSTVFTVFFLGFIGAQPYLGGLPDHLHVPRLDTPRPNIPAGSVGIGGLQAGMVTIDQPSGFNFIGWSPLLFYHPELSPPSRFNAGDHLIFREISVEDVDDFKGKTPEPNMNMENR